MNLEIVNSQINLSIANQGAQGLTGEGVPTGGTTGQILSKASDTNFDTEWNDGIDLFVPYTGATTNVNLGNYSITSFSATFTGAAIKQGVITANTSTAYSIDPTAGKTFNLTLNSAAPVLTFVNGTTGFAQYITVNLFQDATGGRNPSFVNTAYYSGAAPTINQGANSKTTLELEWSGSAYTLYEAAPLITPASFGGTGVSNLDTSTITLDGAIIFTGAYTFTSALIGDTNITWPTNGRVITDTTNFMPGDDDTIVDTTYTLQLTDAGAYRPCSNASSQVITVPPYSEVPFLPDIEIAFEWRGVGQPSFVAAPSVTINSSGGALKITDRYSVAVLKKDHTAINTWTLFGNITV